ncbi:hypothetical protein DM02DRAFT_559119 [Periconia macrospinosa]|uniref:DNA-binding protein RAP1 n=1 Tax=Periconia macrospinosa TaxID=97972 RepID=A0A2V1DZQ2_9PLEO|nr:hypothetical protein DM02DRAFT_559119 [Periconia macrospinosa]
MAAPTVYDDVPEDADVQGQLFSGISFWVAQRVPMRTHFLDQIKTNGGTIIALEKKADYMIADHCRHDCPPGSISYTFIEKSIKAGELQNPNDHLAGPPVGSASEATARRGAPSRNKRTKFTAEEDRILYKWVRDCEGKGGAADGNEIYKQLEAIHPEHPWSSWRERYRRHLRDRPPSAFNIPDNAPPSPPTDDPKAEPTATGSVKPATKQTAVSSSSKDTNTDTISLADLGKLFSTEEWEELYAFKEDIDSITGDEYINAWKAYAEGKTQTAKQWQEYFERVVKPQWENDSELKRQEVKRNVEKRLDGSQEIISGATSEGNVDHEENAESVEIPPTAKGKRKRDDTNNSRFEQYLADHHRGEAPPGYMIFAEAHKWSVWQEQPELDYSGLHEVLMSKWNALSPQEKYHFADKSGDHTSNKDESIDNPRVQLSSSTAVDETPEYIAEVYEKATKSISQKKNTGEPETIETDASHDESSPPSKRRKSAHTSPSPQRTPRPALADLAIPTGTQLEPFEISSGVTSSSPPEMEPNETINKEEQKPTNVGSDIFNSDPIVPPSADPNDYPSNTPTPRTSRVRNANAFNTQAILSSPLCSSSISPLPLPREMSQDYEDDYVDDEEQNDDHEDHGDSTLVPFSPTFEPPSDTSTTHSMQEFRQSLNSHLDEPIGHQSKYVRNHNDLEEQQSQPSSPQPLPTTNTRRTQPPGTRTKPETLTALHFSSSPPPSSAASTTSTTSTTSSQIDPDPPLTSLEIEDFFATHHQTGHSDAIISAALKRTRCRPALAALVLESWANGEETPRDTRGVWSEKDDVDVESGDAGVLKKLEDRHTMDGWGGVVERLRFLAQYRGDR